LFGHLFHNSAEIGCSDQKAITPDSQVDQVDFGLRVTCHNVQVPPSPIICSTWMLVASFAGNMAVPLMQCPFEVRAGIRNSFRVSAIACGLFTKDSMVYLTSTNRTYSTGQLAS